MSKRPKGKGKPPVNTRPRSKLMTLPKKPRALSKEELTRELNALTAHLAQGAFNSFVIMGHRRLTEAEKKLPRYEGLEESPYYFSHFPNKFQAGALAAWVGEDIQRQLIIERAQQRKQQLDSAESQKENE